MKALSTTSLFVAALSPTCTQGQSSCCGNDTVNTVIATYDELDELVTNWTQDVQAVENQYGPINCWNVSQIDDMRNMFRYVVDLAE